MRLSIAALGLVAAVVTAASWAPAQETKSAPAPQAAAATCANVAENECGSTAGCVWLPGYKVAGGAEVAGYCRPAPKPLTARRPPAQAQ